ncbi:hypothetical protein HHK36_002739 [Tetracentron sinense]|uniref:Interferon-related developmental regulator N-terminal domain-containing protein n=1 Tax=Tetracentron sinense TaxID=13715 RepID=A0A834ZN15_TETSI|nr:hypothetical protein HHK36_002739 [Tetracentron sinense]
MGKRSSKRKSAAAAMFDSDDDDSVSSSSTAMSDLSLAPETEEVQQGRHTSLDQYLDALFEKRGSTREKALSSIVEAFSNNMQHQFVEKKFVTLLHQCVNSIKRGSTKEISLASHAIGLLAVTVGCGDNALEILEESVPSLAQALKSGSESSKISSVVVSKPSASIITAAISAWSFLLTTLDGCRLNSKNWQESISYFSSLLDKDDRSVRIAAGEAIALIFETGSLDKLSGEAKSSSDSSVHEGTNSRGDYAHMLGLRGKILGQVRILSVEAGGKGSAKKDLNSQRNLFRDVQEFLEENEFLHEVFMFIPKKKNLSGNEQHISSSEKVGLFTFADDIV